MTPLRKRMIEEMELRNFAPKTIELYVDNVRKVRQAFSAKARSCSGRNRCGQYLVHLVEERKLAWGTYNQALAALRYLYRWGTQAGRCRPGQSRPPARATPAGGPQPG